jgi:hypothetical protein
MGKGPKRPVHRNRVLRVGGEGNNRKRQDLWWWNKLVRYVEGEAWLALNVGSVWEGGIERK